jgi:hypothetical protein
MSASLRFLAVAVLAWGGFRAATLGIIPGAEAFAPTQAEAAVPPPIVPTVFPPLPPVEALAPPYAAYPQMTPIAVPYYYPVPAPAPAYPAAAPAPQNFTPLAPMTAPVFYSEIPQLDDWPLSRIAASAASRPWEPPQPGVPQVEPRLDRLQLTAWALLRGRSSEGSLAGGGTLGGSQAGARLTYALNRNIAASLRTYSPVGGASGGEVAAGVRLTPFPSLPFSITAERRQRVGKTGSGRSAFALFAEGGLYQMPLPLDFSLDAYAQAGIVGFRSRDLFADGGLAVMRPIYGPVSVGLGMWGGAQPGLYRVDAGPRLSLRVRRNMRVDLDWRQRLAGDAEPGSGPALTLAGNF